MKNIKLNPLAIFLIFIMLFVNLTWSRRARFGFVWSKTIEHPSAENKPVGVRTITAGPTQIHDGHVAGRVTLFHEKKFSGACYYEHHIDTCVDVPRSYDNVSKSLNTHGTCVAVCNQPCDELWDLQCQALTPCNGNYNNGTYNDLYQYLPWYSKVIFSLRPCNHSDYEACPYHHHPKNTIGGNGTTCDVNSCAIELGCKSYKVCTSNISQSNYGSGYFSNPDQSIGQIVEIGCPQNYFPQAIDVYNSEPGKVALAACRRWEDLDYKRQIQISEDPECAPCYFISNGTCSSQFKYRSSTGKVGDWQSCPHGQVIDVKLRSCVNPCQAAGHLRQQCIDNGVCRGDPVNPIKPNPPPGPGLGYQRLAGINIS